MSNLSFRLMCLIFNIVDAFYKYIPKRIENFGIAPGMTIVDYGCGPGRYTFPFAEKVGSTGKIYATDIHELAVKAVQKRAARNGIHQVEALLAEGYNTSIPSKCADMVCALDMFFIVSDTNNFLGELHRICKPGGTLILDDGHQSRSKTLKAIQDSSFWEITEQTADHIKCKPYTDNV